MKKILVVGLLLMSLASVASADGSGLPPASIKPKKADVIRIADGSGLPPGEMPGANIAA